MFFFSKISLTIYNIHQILKSIHFTHTKFSDLYPRFPQWNLLYMLPCWVSLVLWTGFQIETRQTEQNIVISSGKPSKVPRTRCIWVISSVRASSLSFRLRVSPLPSIFCRKNDLIRCFISFYVSILYFRSFLVHTPPANCKNTNARPSGRVRLAGAASARHRALRISTNTAPFVIVVVDVPTPHSLRNRTCDTPTRPL